MQIIRELNDKPLKSAEEVVKYLEEFRNEDREYFIVVGLDSKNSPVFREIAHIGTLNSTLIHPREVFKKAIMMSCNSIIIAHNHPSGSLEPSSEDTLITDSLKDAGELLQVNVLDHIIITKDSYKSMVEG